MKIYFGANGIGLGHVGRCVPIAKMLQEMGHEVAFSTYKEAVDYVKRENITVFNAPSLSFAVKPDGGIDFRQTTVNPGIFSIFIFLKQLRAEIEFIRSYDADVVVSDSRISTIVASLLLNIPVTTILNLYRITIPREKRFLRLAQIADGGILTVVGKIWMLSQSILIPDFPQPYTLSQNNLGTPPSREKKIKLIGPIIPLPSDNLPEKELLRKKLGIDHRPLIFVPISGSSEERTYLTSLLKHLLQKFPRDYNIIMSLGYPSASVEPIRDENVVIYDWLPNRFEVLKACDLLISRASLGTLTQAICYGKPLLLIPTPSQTEQHNNALRASEIGVATILEQNKISYDTLLSMVQEMLISNSYTKRACEVQTEVTKYNAIETIVETIVNSR